VKLNFRSTLIITVSDMYNFTSGVGTKIDPTLCRADRMVGQVLGAVGALPDIYTELTISFFLLRRLLGVKTEGDKRGAKVGNLIFLSFFLLIIETNTTILIPEFFSIPSSSTI